MCWLQWHPQWLQPPLFLASGLCWWQQYDSQKSWSVGFHSWSVPGGILSLSLHTCPWCKCQCSVHHPGYTRSGFMPDTTAAGNITYSEAMCCFVLGRGRGAALKQRSDNLIRHNIHPVVPAQRLARHWRRFPRLTPYTYQRPFGNRRSKSCSDAHRTRTSYTGPFCAWWRDPCCKMRWRDTWMSHQCRQHSLLLLHLEAKILCHKNGIFCCIS